MKNLIYCIVLLFVTNNINAQRQLTDYVAGKGNLSQVGGTATTLDISVSFTDDTGVFDGTSIDSTCVLVYFNINDNKAYELPIIKVLSSSVSNPVVRVSIGAFSTLSASVTGQGIVYKKTSANSTAPFISGVNSSLQQAVQRGAILDIENRITTLASLGVLTKRDTTISAAYAIAGLYNIINVNATAGNVIVTLPSLVGTRALGYTIVRADNTANVVTINDASNVFVAAILKPLTLVITNINSAWSVN